MKRVLVLTLTTGLLLTGTVRSMPAADPPASTATTTVRATSPQPPAAGAVRAIGATAAEEALLAWAKSRFHAAGLTLPAIDVYYAPDSQSCDGLAGYAAAGGETPLQVHLCSGADPQSLVAHRVLLHELAHAWAAATLTERTRKEFLTLRHLPSWEDAGTPWELRGTEQAAEVMAWALLDREVPVVTIRDADPATLAAAYRVLTGESPPAR
jgi:hypothetical protein